MRRLYLIAFISLGFVFFVPQVKAQTPAFSAITNAIDDLTQEMASSMPVLSTTGAIWSDSYIGSVLGVPPHLGIGLTIGAVSIPVKGIQPLLDAIGSSVPRAFQGLGLVMPAYTINARIGGIFLPFDLGVRVGFIPNGLMKGDASLDYLIVGTDIRYAILQDELVFPGVSVGVGFNYLKTNVGTSLSIDSPKSFTVGAHTLSISDPQASFGVESWGFDFMAQVSKSFFLFTPYAGVTVGVSTLTTTAAIASTMTYDGNPINQAAIDDLNSSTGASFTNTGLKKASTKNYAMRYTLFGGTSVNVLLLKFDLQLCYNLPSNNMGIFLGTRVQL